MGLVALKYDNLNIQAAGIIHRAKRECQVIG
jgi:hypothetical protein